MRTTLLSFYYLGNIYIQRTTPPQNNFGPFPTPLSWVPHIVQICFVFGFINYFIPIFMCSMQGIDLLLIFLMCTNQKHNYISKWHHNILACPKLHPSTPTVPMIWAHQCHDPFHQLHDLTAHNVQHSTVVHPHPTYPNLHR